jgi:hypothetical protein
MNLQVPGELLEVGVNVKFAPFLMKEEMMVGYYFCRFAIPMIQSLPIALEKSSSLICIIRKKKENVIV